MSRARGHNGSGNTMVEPMVFAALFLAIAQVLPFVTGQIPQVGSALSPMHIPVLLCGFLCGWPWGLVIGFIAPLMRSVLFGMPALFPEAVAMAFELAAYGAISGWLYPRLRKNRPWGIYLTLVIAMVLGRVCWGLAQMVLMGLTGGEFTLAIFFTRAFANALPGIITHIALIPLLVLAMERAGLYANR